MSKTKVKDKKVDGIPKIPAGLKVNLVFPIPLPREEGALVDTGYEVEPESPKIPPKGRKLTPEERIDFHEAQVVKAHEERKAANAREGEKMLAKESKELLQQVINDWSFLDHEEKRDVASQVAGAKQIPMPKEVVPFDPSTGS